MDPATLIGMIQLGKLVIETLDLHARGEITDEEFEQRWQSMQSTLDDNNALWVASNK